MLGTTGEDKDDPKISASRSIRGVDGCVLVGSGLCSRLRPETSGFVLNPILKKLTVASSKLEKPGDVCLLRVNDEILQVNSQLVPGARALAVMKYWKAIPNGSAITFVVRRDGAVTKITTK